MTQPSLIGGKKFFYPLGNTSAVCLTESLPPEQPADILLLGCGDPRNILFTLFSTDQTFNSKLDFTCCDVEPAVLARNILLFTLLAENPSEGYFDKVWNIFYHFYLDQPSLELLQSQCKKLEVVSRDILDWNKSPYARYLRMATEDSLAQLNHHWQLYLKYKGSKVDFQRQVTKSIKQSPLGKPGACIIGALSAGPFWMEAAKSTALHFAHFWKHGVTYSDPAAIALAVLVNPTFACVSGAGDTFSVHYGTDPLQGFHLTPAFTLEENEGFDHLTAAAKSQLYKWSDAYRSAISCGSVTIRFNVGDALSFSTALHYRSLTGSRNSGEYIAQWSAKPLILGEEYEGTSTSSPLVFDVIETSNLADHLGLLNLLTATIPLLRHSPFTALYSEMLVGSGNLPESFAHTLCGDMLTMSALLGLAPQGLLSGFTSVSNIHEIQRSKLQPRQGRFHERVVWKIASLCAREPALVFDPQQLASFLFHVYLNMFEHENPAEALVRNISVGASARTGVIHYTRQGFVRLVKLIKSRTIQMDWDRVMESFISKVENDRTLLTGLNSLQDLNLHLHLSGLYSVRALPGDATEAIPYLGMEKKGSRAENWKALPPTVFITLEVPRKNLEVFTKIDISELRTPILQGEIHGPLGYKLFSSVNTTFGEVLASDSEGSENTNITVNEDPRGWEGSGPLVVFFQVPTWLMCQPSQTYVHLSFKPLLPYTYTRNLFAVELRDRGSVRLSACPPNFTVPKPELFPLRTISRNYRVVVGGFDEVAESILTLAIKVEITDANEKRSLASGAIVTGRQSAVYTMEVAFGNFKKDVHFPFPVDGSRSQLRIARGSSYIEVIVPPFGGPSTLGGFSLNRFPVVFERTPLPPTPAPWNIHSLRCVDKLPLFDRKDRARWAWLRPQMMLSFSDREITVKEVQPESSEIPAFVQLKDTISKIFLQSTEAHGSSRNVIALSDPEGNGIHNIIFVAGIRLDLAAHTVVADAYVLPVTTAVLTSVWGAISMLNQGVTQIKVVGEEQVLWSKLLPAFVERSRNWRHNATCEYIRHGIPVSHKVGNSPLCGCGLGKVGPGFGRVPEWRPFAKFVTRAAISPLFAISYVDPVGSGIIEMCRNRCCKCWKKEEDVAKLLFCSKCKKARYCSKGCQIADWKRHKLECKD